MGRVQEGTAEVGEFVRSILEQGEFLLLLLLLLYLMLFLISYSQFTSAGDLCLK